MDEVMVSVYCTVYNHEKYLRQCLDGFVMQETNFRFEVIVHDDASTDHSADIIREYVEKYPDIFVPIYQTENQHSQGIKITDNYIYPLVKGKYVAICEGDDYWCDEAKLQTQFDVMEQNRENNVFLSLHKVQCIQENGEQMLSYCPDKPIAGGIFTSEEFVGYGTYFQTSSYFMDADKWRQMIRENPEFRAISPVGDEALLMYFGQCGSVCYIDKIMSCYRVMSVGSWSQRVRADKEKNIIHSRRMINTYHSFNQYTDCRFEDSIKKKMLPIQYRVDVYDQNFRSLLASRYRHYFKKESTRYRVYVLLGAISPKLLTVLEKIVKDKGQAGL